MKELHHIEIVSLQQDKYKLLKMWLGHKKCSRIKKGNTFVYLIIVVQYMFLNSRCIYPCYKVF